MCNGFHYTSVCTGKTISVVIWIGKTRGGGCSRSQPARSVPCGGDGPAGFLGLLAPALLAAEAAPAAAAAAIRRRAAVHSPVALAFSGRLVDRLKRQGVLVLRHR